MADSPSRSGSLRVRRTRGGPSRNSSARSSAAWEDYSYLHPSSGSYQQQLQPQQQQIHHSLRSASSRFSLNEQFAATRREYEFGDDDASSILERMTLASDVGDESTIAVSMDTGDAAQGVDGAEGDYYDLLCLAKDPTLTPDQIRRAYHRLLLYLHKDGLPENLHGIAQPFFNQVQRGFETLIDPYRRALYDASRLRHLTNAPDLLLDEDYLYAYDSSLKEQLRQRAADVVQTSSDLGIRFDASKAVRRGSAVTPLDFTLSHSVTVGLPVLGRLIERRASSKTQRISSVSERVPSIELNEREEAGIDQPRESMIYLPPPQVTLTGSVYGIVEEIYRVPLPLLADRYQPLLPLTIPRKRIIQLAEQRPCPLISLKFRQDIIHRTSEDRIAKTSIEVESEALPKASLTARVSHPIHLPNDPDPILLEGSVKTGRPWTQAAPRVGIGIHRWMGAGTAFAIADSGDWSVWPGKTIKLFTDFSQVSKNQLLAEFPTETSASFEVGYTTSPERVPSTAHEDSPRGECGIRGLDYESTITKDGSWTVSASLTADTVGGYLRYGKDVPALPGSNSTRLELELCSNTLLDRHIAVRNLWTVGEFSKLGLELGISLHSLHLSLYWSRLNQRLSIPLLLSPRADYCPAVFFYATAVPLIAFAARHFFSGPKRAHRPAEVDLQAYIARKRAAADDIALVLSGAVDARQRVERQRGGLVIVSAKFGVRGEGGEEGEGEGDPDCWAAEEVADVTVAVAALVEDGTLRIPAGVKKASLLGFWDPAPLRRKALHVRYTWRGRESTVEVMGRDELVLPPARRDLS
ncbi:DnaJ domain-containing protein [Colletotrichum orchidophilum]|uniref:DnaJ domain-containing protein n=1 Tax=Colletotrichum orchidophilum TaxID=1209926 RepID=A0A1G4B5D7_9PEZI|nr:DnaJ domain-containing protein [Colletotrichum orchidophilum]OHE96670.1 DnaJ domain-containing protein [Colletotrichum orchidophilum]